MHRSPRVRNLQRGASSLGLEQHAWIYKHSKQDCVAVVNGISEMPEGALPSDVASGRRLSATVPENVERAPIRRRRHLRDAR